MTTTHRTISHRSPDLAGQTFGRLFVLARAHKDLKNRCWLWRCVCTCQMDVVVHQAVTTSQQATQGSPRAGEMQAILAKLCEYIDLAHIRTCLVRTQDLTGMAKQRSCGCLAKEQRTQHRWKR